MSSDIKPGDLVMVVKPTPCCNKSHDVGRVFTVGTIEHRLSACEACGVISTENMVTPVGESNKGCAPYVLKRLDSPSVMESPAIAKELEVAVWTL